MKIVYAQGAAMLIMRQKEMTHSGLNLHAIAVAMFGITVMMAESMQKTVKPKKCRVCKEPFKPFQTTQVVCGIKCARSHAQATIEKKTRKDTREKKQRLKTRSEWIKDAQKAVNEYVRLRDEKESCISCVTKNQVKSNYWDAGHYRSIGSAPHLRFYTLNIHKQCKRCNRDLSGNVVSYRQKLIERRSESFIVRVESMQNPLRPDIAYLQRLTTLMRKKVRLYRKLRNEVA